MTINFLEGVYGTLVDMGLVHSRKEFCEQWLGRQEGYIRTLRFYRLRPSVHAFAVLGNRLDYYAQHLSGPDNSYQKRLQALSEGCRAKIEERSRLDWIRAEACQSKRRRHMEDMTLGDEVSSDA